MCLIPRYFCFNYCIPVSRQTKLPRETRPNKTTAHSLGIPGFHHREEIQRGFGQLNADLCDQMDTHDQTVYSVNFFICRSCGNQADGQILIKTKIEATYKFETRKINHTRFKCCRRNFREDQSKAISNLRAEKSNDGHHLFFNCVIQGRDVRKLRKSVSQEAKNEIELQSITTISIVLMVLINFIFFLKKKYKSYSTHLK